MDTKSFRHEPISYSVLDHVLNYSPHPLGASARTTINAGHSQPLAAFVSAACQSPPAALSSSQTHFSL